MDVDNTSPVNSGEIWMTAGGNVGIGTSTAGEKLEVSGNIKLTGGAATYRIRNVADPGLPQDVATKAYVDAAVTAGNPSSWTCTVRSAGGFSAVTVSCSGNEKVISGGCYFQQTIGGGRGSYPANQGWTCDDTANSGAITAYANCCQ
jgi:hypothetical protein